ncbi:sulfatase [Micromonospora sp. WMMD712]|nr:sulfatase-like hydrolase/transferase [Micromonospora sp. WMMD712]WFE55537.1 sulfatase [Micromonospora sp. WMMD712]
MTNHPGDPTDAAGDGPPRATGDGPTGDGPPRATGDDTTGDETTDATGNGTGGDGGPRAADDAGRPVAVPGRGRRVRRAVGGTLAALLVAAALTAPDQLRELSPAAFLRLPVEALIVAAALLALPPRPRRVVAALAGAALGLVTVVRLTDLGFQVAWDRPFDLVSDWVLFDDAYGFLAGSIGRPGAVGVAVGVVLLAVALLVTLALAALRLAALLARHDTGARRAVAALTVGWVACAAFGVRIVPGVPVADSGATAMVRYHAAQVRGGLSDGDVFAAEVAADRFRDTPGDELLTALRGKDVVVAFVESYGRDAVEEPEFAQVGAVLDEGTRRLRAAGFASRSAYLTSPTAGGGSWLAHATLLSGLWIDSQQRHRSLLATDRLTLGGAFQRAGWRTVGVMPGALADWPEGGFYGYDRFYPARELGYQGPKLGYFLMPDQYALSELQRRERSTPGHPPVMAEIPLTSSHSPWTSFPRVIDWDDVGDGSVYHRNSAVADVGGKPVRRTAAQIRADYRRTVEYTLKSLISYVETYGDDDLVLVFLGDHQPAPVVTGEDASRDVPVTVVARDPKVLDRIDGWQWQDGLRPGPDAPVWRMDTFRDRFLTAFGSRPGASAPPAAAPR